MTGPPSLTDRVRDDLERAIGFQYEIIRLLGRGGMGAVYHAHERALDRPVAIKVLPPDVALISEGRERFLREARTAARLTHPNIVPLFTFGEANGLLYYVMGYVEGESLEQRLRRVGKCDVSETARILEELANALHYAHEQGVVHRDVKPDNVLIEYVSGAAKLTDFGIAKRPARESTLTGTGVLIGTPRYMSPEQASGDHDVDARSDIYSLGLLGYALLAGRPPFDGSLQEVLAQQVTRDPTPVSSIRPDAPSTLTRAIDGALAKDRAQRWPTADAMAAVLREDEDDALGLFEKLRRPGAWAISAVVTTLFFWDAAWWIANGPYWLSGWTIVVALSPAVSVAIDYGILRWKEKRSRAELRRTMTEPPQWWSLWWPKRFRRADDVWYRLPHEVRRTRIIGSVGVGLFALGLELGFLALTGRRFLDGAEPLLTDIIGATVFSVFAGSLLAMGAAVLRRQLPAGPGLSAEDRRRLVVEPTAKSSFWSKPHIARLLKEQPTLPSTAVPRTPSALAEAILDVVRQLPSTLQSMAEHSGTAARQLVRAIDVLDREIANIARDEDPTELSRLEQRLSSLGEETASDSVDKREMRRLYASQKDLFLRLGRQREELAARRTRYAELLRTLWLQISTLRTQNVPDVVHSQDITGLVLELCRRVEREVEAAREANDLLSGDTSPLPH